MASGYDLARVRLYSINENYLDTVDNEIYYMPVEIAEKGKGTEVVRMMYSQDRLSNKSNKTSNID